MSEKIEKFVPLYNKVVVKLLPEDVETKTPSGIIITARNAVLYYKGIVISVGKGCYQNAVRLPIDIVEGDKVIFLKKSGMTIKFDGYNNPEYIMLADTDIWSKLEDVETESK